MSRLLKLLLCALAFWPSAVMAQEQPRLRVGYVFSDGNVPGTLAAYKALLQERPELHGRIDLQFLTESTFKDVDPQALAASDVLIYDIMNEQMLRRFDEEKGTNLLASVSKRGVVLGVGQGLNNEAFFAELGVKWDPRARAYWEHSGPQNRLALLKLALGKAGISGFESLPEPQVSLDFGYYYPDGGSGRLFATWEEFQAWRQANGKLHAGAPRVAVGFFKANYYTGDTGLIDAVIAEAERQGAEVVPVFGYPGAVAFQRLLGEGDKVRADVGLGLFFQFNDETSAKVLEKVGIPVINLISLYGRSEEEWRNSPTGLSAFEGTFNLAAPELAGTVAPTVVGTKEKLRDPETGLNMIITRPIASRVEMAVKRGLRYATLSRKPNAEKRVAVMYYNYPPGKAGIAASYLNVAESLANILARMKAEGYDTGGPAPTADQILLAITTKARNVASDAPGELDEMIALGGVQRIPVTDYRRWLNAMTPALRDKILADWGDPAAGKLMTERRDDEVNLIIPGIRYGNIMVMPQPSRAWGEDLEKLYHAKDLAPAHQYVAAYAWLRNGFNADAVVHVGTHGTLEWLDGRDAGLGEEDAPDALIADLPDAYIYNVDVVGEGLVARRRGMATLVDHMVPPFTRGGLTEDLAKLSELLNDHIKNESKNPELSRIYGRQAREAAVKLGVAKDVGLDPDVDWTDQQLHQVEDYLLELREQIIPYGLHAFGRLPETEAIDSTVDAILSVDRSALPDAVAIFGDEMRGRIVMSATRELDGLMTVLGGRFVPADKGGEPVRNPDSYPTGANFYGIDPDKVPKPASWEMGSKLAEQMLQDFRNKNGRYPSKISFVIWGDETMRHEGVLESQIFYLLGTKPVWDARGKLVDVEVIPRAQLGRPRVDIVIASSAEGLFSNVTRMMDKAVQQVKALDEDDNQVRKHYLEIKRVLIKRGIPEADADKMAGVRIFDEPPGTYNLNTSGIVAASGSWDSEAGFANEYIRKMGHGFGNGYWGQPMPDVFKLALSGTDTIVHSNSTMLYGTLDNDDMFMYMGGLASAVRSLDGTTPDLLITDTRDPGKPAMAGLDKFLGREFRSRYVNPTWIKGMQKEGYAGAGAMREFVEYLWGWDATATDVVDDAMWQETFATYVQDKHKLGMRDWFESNSPFAYQDMTGRMIETVRKGYWNADQATRAELYREYLENVEKNGVNCTAVSCGNGRMLAYVMDEAKRTGVPASTIAAARSAFEKAMKRSIESAAADLEGFVRRNDARENAERAANRELVSELRSPTAQAGRGARMERQGALGPSSDTARSQSSAAKAAPDATPKRDRSDELVGQVMTEDVRSNRVDQPQREPMPTMTLRDMLWPFLALLALLGFWLALERRGAPSSIFLAIGKLPKPRMA